MNLLSRLFKKTAVLDYSPSTPADINPLSLPASLLSEPRVGTLRFPPPRTPPSSHKLWSLFDIRGENDCWPWIGTGSVQELPPNKALPKEYQVRGMVTVNRCVYAAATRSKPKGIIKRTCRDVTPEACGNVAHLYDTGQSDAIVRLSNE